MEKALLSLLRPIESIVFYLFLLLNLVSNEACFYYFHNANQFFLSFALSFFLAYVESFIYNFISFESISKIYIIIVCIFYNILIIIDYFLIFNFHIIFNEDVVDILLETNRKEIASFIDTFLPIPIILLIVISLVSLNIVICIISRLLYSSNSISISKFSLFFSFIGFLVLVYSVFSFIQFKNGMSIPQYASITRFSYISNVAKERILLIHQLQIVCENTEAICEDPSRPTVVVVIGESHSVYHSSLYGYPLETNPLLKKRLMEGNLYKFDDVVSVDDHTHGAMKSVFSLNSYGQYFGNTTLFPRCFKVAGYYTAMYDNQYFVGTGISFLSDEKLSNLLFDERNKSGYVLDGDMIDDITVNDMPSLYVIHLLGQHYTYEDRYPKDFGHFTANDYDENQYDQSQRYIIAHYDNACLYNDHVIDKIIQKFEDKNAILFYFSDHGEEVYELRDYMGHGDAIYSPDLRYQIRIPLLVYTTDSYIQTHDSICNQLRASEHKRIISDDISHVILSVASIKTKDFSHNRCFTEVSYEEKKPRLVLHSIDFNLY